MVIAYDLKTVEEYVAQAAQIGTASDPKRPILIDQFLEDATEVDVDALADGEDVVIAGIMEHIEEAGIHSGDSSCVLPSVTLKPAVLERIRDYTARLAKRPERRRPDERAIRDPARHGVRPRSESARLAHDSLRQQSHRRAARKSGRAPDDRPQAARHASSLQSKPTASRNSRVHDFYAVKSPVFPFNKFRGVDTILGPEMRSTGEVMGISSTFGLAFAKAQLAAGQRLPLKGTVFISVNDHDKRHVAGRRAGPARRRT